MKSIRQPLTLLLLAAVFACGYASAQESSGPWQESYLLEAAGNYSQAAFPMEKILRESPNNEYALLRSAWLNYLQGRYNEALRGYNLVLALNPKALDARLGLTLPLLAQQRWREAALESRKVLAVSAWDYTGNVRLMVSEEGERNWEELSRHASEMALRYPSEATPLVYLARAEAWLGNTKKAKSAYAQVLERIPTHPEAMAYLTNHP